MIFQNFGFNQNYPVAAVIPPEPTSGIQRLAVSSSLWAYYDIAFTSSYSSSGQTTVFDLSGNGNNGSTTGTVNYNTAGISGSVLRLGASSDANRVQMPSLTNVNGGGITFVIAYYITSGVYGFGAIELFGDRDAGQGDYWGIYALDNATWQQQFAASIENYAAIPPPQPVNSASPGSWHISQFSFNDTTNVWNWCADGVTGSYTDAVSFNSATLTNICWNHNPSGLTRYLNSGSMMQVMAVYTGSLSSQQLVDNHNSLKLRYGL